MTNFGTALDPQSIDVGYSSGGQWSRGHGDGLPLAALVFTRQSYHLCIASRRDHWTFTMRGPARSVFDYEVEDYQPERCSHGTDHRSQTAAHRTSVPLVDGVSIIIGPSSRPGARGKSIELSDFRSWLQMTLDVYPPENMVKTGSGDLILDPDFSGRLFCRGIRLRTPHSVRKAFVYGYNFLDGRINRDRQRMSDVTLEARRLAAIWEAAIAERPELVSSYLKLLRYAPTSTDVSLADRMVSYRTASQLWATLASQANEHGLFYYEKDLVDTVGRLSDRP